MRPATIRAALAECLTAEQVAAELGITPAAVRSARYMRRLPADTRIGRTPIWFRTTIEKHKNGGTVKRGPKGCTCGATSPSLWQHEVECELNRAEAYCQATPER